MTSHKNILSKTSYCVVVELFCFRCRLNQVLISILTQTICRNLVTSRDSVQRKTFRSNFPKKHTKRNLLEEKRNLNIFAIWDEPDVGVTERHGSSFVFRNYAWAIMHCILNIIPMLTLLKVNPSTFGPIWAGLCWRTGKIYIQLSQLKCLSIQTLPRRVNGWAYSNIHWF
jgi:hypothetical protein